MQTTPKPNYQRELEQTLSTIPAGTKPHLFLHACCAPCSSYVLEYLSRYFTITIYFYNPNIMPEAEFSHWKERFLSLPEHGNQNGFWLWQKVMNTNQNGANAVNAAFACDWNRPCRRQKMPMRILSPPRFPSVRTKMQVSSISAVQSWQSNLMSRGYMQISRKRAVISVRLHCPTNMTCIGKISAAVYSPPQTAMQHLIKHQKYKKSAAFAAFFHVTPVSRRFSKNLLAIARET